MGYIDGFAMAVPTGNRQKFIDHAELADTIFIELGALRVTECWGDDIPDGELTDFRKAVQAEAGETVVISWVEWPDREFRDKAMKRMQEMIKTDPRFDQQKNPMPFDGKRMIFGGFSTVVDMTG